MSSEKVLDQADFAKSNKLCKPGCQHTEREHGVMSIRGACHLMAGVRADYKPEWGAIVFRCKECDTHICCIAVATECQAVLEMRKVN